MKIKALTIWQPYASLLVLGLKRFETRGWMTSYRGPLVIHAAKRCDRNVVNDIARVRKLMQSEGLDESCRERFGWSEAQFRLGTTPWDSDNLFGRALGWVELTDCRRMLDGGSEFENEVGTFGAGRCGWECSTPIAFEEPIAVSGKQGIWIPPIEVEAEVRAEMAVA